MVDWKAGFSPGVDAKTAHEEVERIREKNDGLAAPAVIVDESRKKNAPLHPVFEWDDYTAAERHRRWQARQLVTAFRIEKIDHGEGNDIPIYVSVIKDEKRGYMPTDLAVGDEDTAAFVVREALTGLRAWQRRYEGIDALSHAVSGVRDLIEKLE